MTSAYKGLLAVALVFGFALSAAAQTSSTVAGTVKDAQGLTIPGATVTLISESRGTTFETQAGTTGDFVVSNVPADTYTVRVTMDGFKTTGTQGRGGQPWRARGHRLGDHRGRHAVGDRARHRRRADDSGADR